MAAAREAAPLTSTAITAGLRDVGIGDGGVLLVHSRMSSFGRVDGGADAVIDALHAAVGPPGTICMPALSYGDYGPHRPPPPFDPRTTPTATGQIPERFRRRPGVLRSLHPTHSMSAAGPLARDLLCDHHRSPSPCGPGSPWARVAERGAVVVLLGVGPKHCTLFHGPEGEVELEARCFEPVPCVLVGKSGPRTVPVRLHRPYWGAVSRRAALEPVLEAEGLLRRTKVGACTVLVIDAPGLWDISVRRLRKRPVRPVDRLQARTRHVLRRGADRLRRARQD